MQKKVIITLLVLFVIAAVALIFPELASAQPGSPPPVFPDKPEAVPIDGGLTLLAAAGGGYAIKKLRDRKK